MIEQFTEGIVLKRTPRSEFDSNITLYTKDLGKISTFAKSIRKPTSKLSGHMMPGNVVRTRIVEKNNIQAVDALGDKSTCNPQELIGFLYFLDAVIPQGVPDVPLWHAIKSTIEKCNFGPETYSRLLEILGFGGNNIGCNLCRKNKIAYFSVVDIIFLCVPCKERARRNGNEVIAIR